VETLLSIYRGEGLGGFYKGLRAKILQSILAGAILLSVKERLYDVTAASLRSVSPAATPVVAPLQKQA